jgi:hypothetical protein
MKQFIVFILVLITLSSFSPAIETFVTGHLKSKSKKYNVKNRLILVKYHGKIVSSTTTDNKGNFSLFFNLNSGESTPVYFYYQNVKDTILIKRVTHFVSQEPEINFYIP